jgi:ABC-2 type transporter
MALLLASFSGDTDAVFVGIGGSEFYVTSYLAAAIAAMGFMGTPTHLTSYRSSGVLRRFRAAGVPARSLVVAQTAVIAALAIVGTTIMLAMAYTIAGWTPTGLLVDAIHSPWIGRGDDVTALVVLAVIAVAGRALAIRRLTRPV